MLQIFLYLQSSHTETNLESLHLSEVTKQMAGMGAEEL